MEKGGMEAGTAMPKIFLYKSDLYLIKMLRTNKVQDRYCPFKPVLDPRLHIQHQPLYEINKNVK